MKIIYNVTWHHLYCVFTYISLLIEKDLCECQNVSAKFLCVLFSAFNLETSSFFFFFGKSFPFLLLFLNLWYKMSIPRFNSIFNVIFIPSLCLITISRNKFFPLPELEPWISCYHCTIQIQVPGEVNKI